ncbi:MAG: nitroreductase [Puniceicoccales bacterium]|jgi:nitroreductase|nr:nitroreductase [Puniceicoccales bacterium]
MEKFSNLVVETILNRSSVRSYKSDQIDGEALSVILKCGLRAPNGWNHQPWDIVYVQDKTFLDELNFAITSDSNNSVFYHAPTVVFISGNRDDEYYAADCPLAAENMVIAAASIGIGSCIIAYLSNFLNSQAGQVYKERLSIPENYEVCIAVALGHPTVPMHPHSSRDESKIRRY